MGSGGADYIKGAQSGSHIANDEVRKIVTKVLDSARSKEASIKPGDLAKYMLDFERQKKHRGFNYVQYIRKWKQLHLHNDDGLQLRIDISPQQIRSIFRTAFKDGLYAIQGQLEAALSSPSDIAVLFCGGSFLGPGLRSEIASEMADFQEQAQREEITVAYDFLGNFEKNWQVDTHGNSA